MTSEIVQGHCLPPSEGSEFNLCSRQWSTTASSHLFKIWERFQASANNTSKSHQDVWLRVIVQHELLLDYRLLLHPRAHHAAGIQWWQPSALNTLVASGGLVNTKGMESPQHQQ
eukprot:6335079-Amphidinium_carterae.1